MKIPLRNMLLALLMLIVAGLAIAMRPTQKIAELGEPINLIAMVPTQFGEWTEEIADRSHIVDPQQSALLTKLYSQILSRTYKNAKGNHIMLSIAYGSDQRDSMQVHYPEVCYPAQGFQLQSQETGRIDLAGGSIPVRRLDTRLGGRHEFVTYWVMIGDKAVLGGTEKKLAELKYGLKGFIPDGLLFRISSLGGEGSAEYRIQESFVAQMNNAVPGETGMRLFGVQRQATGSRVGN